ncbi:PREDICTED: uncharacterized protein LOC108770516 [Trachymyrmex cornetzi]|uniref:uncharacterized protein LOC108770516 n=1 Tax=Trachymyrmex cornetzi TaxID=471704 RepID=UPI00084F575D|nr:PREDICTED: uncharacterized protein LOC108770516 [Trachymyrmex cornetzi]
MEVDMRKLKQRRAQTKGTRILHFFEAGNVTIDEAQVRLQKLEEFYYSFKEIQSTIDDRATPTEEEGEQTRIVSRLLFIKMTAVQKHQYLIGVLQGEARSVIEGFRISSENYENAWKLLKDTYDNNMVIIENHLDELLNFPEITKNNKADSIRKFIWHIQTHVSALKTLALPVDEWDAILLQLAKKKLDFIEQRDWQNLIKNRTPQNISKLSEFMTFLTERCHTMKILKQGHYIRECKGSTCKRCDKKHNSIIHKEDQEERGNAQVKSSSEDTPKSVVTTCTESNQCLLHKSARCQSDSFDREGSGNRSKSKKQEERHCRALLDPGSQSNLVTADLIRKLKLSCRNEVRPINGINKTITRVGKATCIHIKSIHSEFETTVDCLVVPEITEQLQQTKIEASTKYIPKDVKLADPTYDKPGSIDMLLGAGVYWKIVSGAPENQIKGKPALQDTHLGVIIGGELTEKHTTASRFCNMVTNTQLQDQLQRFWRLEEMPESRSYTKEEIHCEKFFILLRNKKTVDSLFDCRLIQVASLAKDPTLKEAYKEFLNEYRQQGHMSLVENPDVLLAQEHYIIPHQPVVRPDSMTTKLRVVFEASSKTTNGNSLNDKLMPGPNLQADLQQFLMRFRTHEFVLTADVTSMFRQILVDPRDRKLQLILWRDEATQSLQLYQLNTMTYGTVCAPYLAMRCLKELAEIHKQELPLAAKVVEQDFYMNNVLTGGSTLEYVLDLQKQLIEMLDRGKFPLRKWRASSLSLLEHLSEHSRANNLLVIDEDQPLKTLGLLWNANQTRFNTESHWRRLHQTLSGMYYPRYHKNVNINNKSTTFDIYEFGDASETAYGACLYAVSTDEQGISHSELICARAKVAPLKTISLPRLELEAALLLSQLYNIVKRACADRINKVILCSDSTVTLGWIKTLPHTLKTFVANRISKIFCSLHVASEDNPADLLSRGVTMQRLIQDQLFAENCRSNRKTTPFSLTEMERAEKVIIRWVQQESFPMEIHCLQENRLLPRKSPLCALAAYLDNEGLIRVGGRLRHAEIQSDQKNPIVLLTRHDVTSILLRDRHKRLLHCPPEQLLFDIRLRFWPISGRREVRKVVKRCVKCYRFNPTTTEVKMGDLPVERVRSYDRPFTVTGIDYAGPIQVRESRRRERIHVSKGYIAIFVCTSTKAVHLEMVTNLSTEAFMASLRRFTSRRDLCSQILSDNGTNFVGATRHLNELYEFLAEKQDAIKSELAEQRIEWYFIPPRAPNFGGLWEAMVKSTKRHLYTVTEGCILTYEEYSTLLSQIEAVLNSRPLHHFRMANGSKIKPIILEPLADIEYLQELQKRTKWTASRDNMKKDDLVIIQEDHVPLFNGGEDEYCKYIQILTEK